MAKVALITDTHVGVRNDSPVFHEYLKDSFRQFFKTVDDEGVDYVVHAGDLYDRRKYINFVTAKLCREEFIEQLNSRKIQTHIIAGNHDVYWKNTNEVSSLNETVGHGYESIKIHTEPCLINIDGLNIQLLPWINDENRTRFHDAVLSSKAKVLIGHLELAGFEMYAGSMMDHGDDKQLYEKFKIVLSGHYHHKSSSGNIHYLGAFGEYTWADYNDPRGYHIFDTKTLELRFISNNNRVFKTIKYDDSKDDIMDTVQASDFSECNGAYIKVICVNRTNPFVFDMMLDKLNNSSPADVIVVENTPDYSVLTEDEETGSTSGDDSHDHQDTQAVLNKCIDELQIEIDNQKMKKLMADIYTEALSAEDVT